MKIRCVPEDFQVTEHTDLTASAGRYALYRLQKRSIGTPEALQQIRRAWNLAGSQIQHAGLKDRHAVTTQYVTIRNGPRAGLTLPAAVTSGGPEFSRTSESESDPDPSRTDSAGNQVDRFRLQLEYLGQTPAAITAADILSNRFQIVLRNLPADHAATICQLAKQSSVVPNYFDSQRFGSLGASRQFVAAAWCRKDYERALWLALAEHNHHDRPDERRDKQLLRDHWGDWVTCKQQLQRSHRRSIVTYLVDHPDKFRKAFALLNPDLRGLYLSALQSAVWNRMLAQQLTNLGADDSRWVQIGDARLPLPLTLSEETGAALQQLTLPLPSGRCRGLPPALQQLADSAAAPYELKLADMNVSFPRDRFFSRGQRPALLVPDTLSANSSDDQLYPGQQSVTLSFSLPRGSYATMIVKSLTVGIDPASESAPQGVTEDQTDQDSSTPDSTDPEWSP